MEDVPFKIADRTFQSRLIVGTGKYPSHAIMKQCHEASGTELVTVAVRRLDLSAKGEAALLHWIDRSKITLLPNTLFPDVEETLAAARTLVQRGFTVLPYTSDDPVAAKKLEDLGCAAVMPLAAPIGSGLGIRNPHNIQLILEAAKVPIIVDAGVGTASDAAIAMELGCDGVLMNTAIAGAKEPVRMAAAMKKAIEAGREAFLAGRIPRKAYGSASSPIEGLVK